MNLLRLKQALKSDIDYLSFHLDKMTGMDEMLFVAPDNVEDCGYGSVNYHAEIMIDGDALHITLHNYGVCDPEKRDIAFAFLSSQAVMDQGSKASLLSQIGASLPLERYTDHDWQRTNMFIAAVDQVNNARASDILTEDDRVIISRLNSWPVGDLRLLLILLLEQYQ